MSGPYLRLIISHISISNQSEVEQYVARDRRAGII